MAIETFDLGETVICDMACGDDYTGKPDEGGFLYMSKAVCPKCAPDFERTVREYGEEGYIKARCPEGMSFHKWVLSLRGGNNTMKVYTGDDFEEGLQNARRGR